MRRCCRGLRALLYLRLVQALRDTSLTLTHWAMRRRCRACGHRVVLRWHVDEARVGAVPIPPFVP